jgi:DNA polymerase-3 subunit delta
MADTQIYLFTGENIFALTQEKRLWAERFRQKYGEENMTTLQGPQLTLRSLLDDISIAPFLSEKRLIFCSGIPKFDADEVEQMFEQIHPATLLVFVEPKPDKRLSAVKALLKTATVKEFPHLSEGQLLLWMQSFAKDQGLNLSRDQAQYIVDTAGEDEELLSHELEKLALFSRGKAVTLEEIRILVVPSGDKEIWTLTNLIAQKKKKEAMAYAKVLLQRGEDPFAVWNILLWMLRQLVSTWMAASEGDTNPASIAKNYSVPFPTAKTLLPLASSLKKESLLPFLDWAVDTDTQLKTGGYRATQESMEELITLIDRFILGCVSLKS